MPSAPFISRLHSSPDKRGGNGATSVFTPLNFNQHDSGLDKRGIASGPEATDSRRRTISNSTRYRSKQQPEQLSNRSFQSCLHTFWTTGKARGMHPLNARVAMNELIGNDWAVEESHIIPFSAIRQKSEFPVASGGFSDIYSGFWKHTQVGIKMLRTFRSQSNERIERRLNREAMIWRKLRHPNIAAFYGVAYEPNGRAAIVMQWYENGTTPNYIAQRQGQVDIRMMLLDIGHGLQYLHSQNPPIVHGDLKGCNTLVTDFGRVVISDFGLSRLVREVNGPSGRTTTTIAGSLRFQAPELLLEETPNSPGTPIVPRFPTDVYAFGCTIYELVTGRLPYQQFKADWHIIRAVTQGILPLQQDDNLIFDSSRLIDLLKSCWQFSSEKRPSIERVLEALSQVQFAPLECRFR